MEGDGFKVGAITEGTETRAETGFRIAFVVTLGEHWLALAVGLGIYKLDATKTYCHSIASSGLSNPSGRAFRRLCMWGSASSADPVHKMILARGKKNTRY